MKFWKIKWENLVVILLTITLIMLICISENTKIDYIMIGTNMIMIPYSYITLKKVRKEMK